VKLKILLNKNYKKKNEIFLNWHLSVPGIFPLPLFTFPLAFKNLSFPEKTEREREREREGENWINPNGL
jgi:hypothetical protein